MFFEGAQLVGENTDKRPVVVAVLGMHRAGTSLSTAMLQAFDVRLSTDLMPATPDNPIGYFESVAIVDAHNAILDAMGRTWRTSSSMAPFPPNWTALPQIQPIREHLKRIVSAQAAVSAMPWGFKDPRTAQLLPLWREIAQELGIDMRFLIVLRHPREVARSLAARDAMDATRGELLWVEHYLDALMYTAPQARAFIAYDAWFGDALNVAKGVAAQLGLPAPVDERVRDLMAMLVSPELRHHRESDEACALPFTRELYVAMLERNESMLATIVPLLQMRRTFCAQVVACALQINSNVVGEQQQRIAQLEAELAKLRR